MSAAFFRCLGKCQSRKTALAMCFSSTMVLRGRVLRCLEKIPSGNFSAGDLAEMFYYPTGSGFHGRKKMYGGMLDSFHINSNNARRVCLEIQCLGIFCLDSCQEARKNSTALSRLDMNTLLLETMFESLLYFLRRPLINFHKELSWKVSDERICAH